MAAIKRPRGTRDFVPAQTAQRHHVASTMRSTFGRFGYHEVQTPTFEELELFTAKSGDGIVSELYDFTDKGDRRLTLRPELTAPVMRMYHEGHQFDAKPLKWYYFGNCFRYDRPQEGRYREFWQFGCEQIGAGTPLAYAELMALAYAVMKEAGLQHVDFQVGNVAVLRHAVGLLELDDGARAQLMRLIDKGALEAAREHAAKAGAKPGAAANLWALLAASDLAAARAAAGDHEGLVELEETMSLLQHFGVQARLNLGIARGLDYYAGIVFEAHSPALGAQSQLLGGGGYDLAKVFGGATIPTMGFGLGFDRLLVALSKEGAEPAAVVGPDVYLGALSPAATTTIVQWATALRRLGKNVDMDLMGRKPGAIAKHAASVGAAALVMVGERDLDGGQVSVKNMATGEATPLALADVVPFLTK